MTQIDQKAVELAGWLDECLSHDIMPEMPSLKKASRAFSKTVDALDAAEARERAAVEAALVDAGAYLQDRAENYYTSVGAAQSAVRTFASAIPDYLEDLSDTDALSEYVARERAKGVEATVAAAAAIAWKCGSIEARDKILALTRQETNDAT
jgi:hypothetical protein